MPRPVGYGRPGTRVFPAGWAEAAAGVLSRTHESVVKIGTPGSAPTWDEASRRTVAANADPSYNGPASIRPAGDNDSASEPVVGEEQVTVARYQVGIPQPTTGIEVGHVVSVTASPDAALVGRDLTVVAVEYGDRRFTRLLYATLND